MNIFLVAILGLVVGSFLNAVIYRLHVGVSFMRGRSYCPHCKHSLVAKDLIPLLSYLLLRGHCRYCHKPISWQYPLVEAAMSIAYVLLYWQFGLAPVFFVYMVFASILMLIFVFDLKYYLILDKVSVPAIVLAFILSVAVLKISMVSLCIGAIAGGGFFLLQFLISRGKWIGGGDIRLGILMGMMLGWPHVLVALAVAYFIGSFIGIALILSRRKKWHSQVPFGTFLTIATYAAFFIGAKIVEYYQGILAI
ncbi:MAG: prepilin peptidase [Patescibacteria group bacterium]|jgi:prepilin signal peptidase PulO-like enzyme (type II secretory pathway)